MNFLFEDDQTKKNWPTEGKITFRNVSLRYNVGAAASIYDVSCTIQPMEKVNDEKIGIL